MQHTPGVDFRQYVPRLAEALLYAVRLAIESSRQRAPIEADTPISVLQRFEKKLHRYIRQRLEHHFGVEHEVWWVEGVPVQIRQDCAQRRELGPEREELYQYTYLIDLKTIVDKNWGIFEADVRAILQGLQKKEFLDYLKAVNDVRNRHAHAVRAPEKGSELYQEDLKLAASSEQLVDLLSARFSTAAPG